jgi:hypothetical protein
VSGPCKHTAVSTHISRYDTKIRHSTSLCEKNECTIGTVWSSSPKFATSLRQCPLSKTSKRHTTAALQQACDVHAPPRAPDAPAACVIVWAAAPVVRPAAAETQTIPTRGVSPVVNHTIRQPKAFGAGGANFNKGSALVADSSTTLTPGYYSSPNCWCTRLSATT